MDKNQTSAGKASVEKGLEIFKKALSDCVSSEFDQFDESVDCEFSDNFKRKMNKIFREFVGPDRIPHPEVEEDS